jgi:molybdopterin converting factor small subunit
MAHLRLPPTLPPLFPELPRRLEVEAPTVVGALTELDRRWPGLFDRLCEHGPTLRPHIHVYVDGGRADLDAPIGDGSRVDVIAAISGG